MKTGLCSAQMPTAKDVVLCELTLVYGETVVAPVQPMWLMCSVSPARVPSVSWLWAGGVGGTRPWTSLSGWGSRGSGTGTACDSTDQGAVVRQGESTGICNYLIGISTAMEAHLFYGVSLSKIRRFIKVVATSRKFINVI